MKLIIFLIIGIIIFGWILAAINDLFNKNNIEKNLENQNKKKDENNNN
jgi:large-conductance mechanosensitive channel|tara:strand:- start:3089 stop:3232 length:144 start_codon:yes stop_codon:yes gene_type:complete